MGYTHWSDDAYDHIKKTRTTHTRAEIFKNDNQVDPALNPHGLRFRESRDSVAHPRSNAIVVAFDVTGSMGTIPEHFAREKLGGLMRMLVERAYIEDPQLLFAAVGDTYSDKGPFQVGQFESGLEMDMWLTRIWLEGGGGGQVHESYGLAHYFAAHHTATDCWEKRRKKGYLFTIGDEKPWDLPRAHLKTVFGGAEADLTIRQVIQQAQERYEVFHIHVAQGHHGTDPSVLARWRELLGERVLVLDDSSAVCELIAGTIGLCEGNTDLARFARDLEALGAESSRVTSVKNALSTVRRP